MGAEGHSLVIRLFSPAEAPTWLRPVLQSIERAIRENMSSVDVIDGGNATGSGSEYLIDGGTA